MINCDKKSHLSSASNTQFSFTLKLKLVLNIDSNKQTQEEHYSLMFDVAEKHGISQLGLMVNESWNQDPKRTLLHLLATSL